MPAQLVVTHERIGLWARHTFSRLEAARVEFRGVETRSRDELVRAVRSDFRPVVIVDVGDRPAAMLADLAAALVENPDASALVIDRKADDEVKDASRAVGAAHVLSGPVTPRDVHAFVSRWLDLARRRLALDGWRPAEPPAPEPWERPELLLNRRQASRLD